MARSMSSGRMLAIEQAIAQLLDRQLAPPEQAQAVEVGVTLVAAGDD